MSRIEAAFWDFDGVWSKDRFYNSLAQLHPKAHQFVQTEVFGPNSNGYVDKWMRAELTMTDINRLISQKTGVDFDLLTKSFIDDVAQMAIEMRHVPIIEKLKQNGVKVGMITNNMDVFSTITAPRLHLLDLFDDRVYNSFTYGVLKADGLYDIAMRKAGLTDYSTALMIDDSPKARTAFEAKGGLTYAYTNFEEFQDWANKNLLH